MAVWSGTKFRVTPDGSNDLMLDEGAGFGYFISDDFTISTDLGYHVIHCRFQVAQDNGGNPDISRIKIYIATSEDDITYTEWLDFWPNPVTAYCKYYRYKITFEAHLNTTYLPKVTAFETIAKPLQSQSRQESINAIMATAPAAPDLGAGYLITTGADADKIHRCVDSDTPTYQKIPMDEGMDVWDRGTKQRIIFSNSKQQKPYCLEGRRPLGYVQEVGINNAVLQTVLEATWAGGTFKEGDEFFVKLATYTGTNVSGFADSAAIQIDDGTGGGYTTVWQAGPEGHSAKPLYLVHITRGALANTEAIARDNATAPASASTTAGLGAAWLTTCTGIKVLARGDSGSKANAEIYADVNSNN